MTNVVHYTLWVGRRPFHYIILNISCSSFTFFPCYAKLLHINFQDEDAFFNDYAISHKKLSELGFTPTSSKKIKDSVVLAQSAVGVVVAAAVVILSYVYEARKRSKWDEVRVSMYGVQVTVACYLQLYRSIGRLYVNILPLIKLKNSDTLTFCLIN